MNGRFSRCPLHVGNAGVGSFVKEYWSLRQGRVLLVGGAGFDARTADVARLLSGSLGTRLDGVFIKEERSDAALGLHQRASGNEHVLRSLCTSTDVHRIEVFEADGAVMGGRRAAAVAQGLDLASYADVVVDLSALSVGTAFPLVRTLWEILEQGYHQNCRLHLMVSASPGIDEGIEHHYGEHVETIHGFTGGWGLDERARAAKAWLPQLRLGRTKVLGRIYEHITPHAVLPVIPFPATDLKLGDKLLEQYQGLLEGAWDVDPRNLVVADERLPLDYYRTVLGVARFRQQTFGDGLPGSVVVLTPMGSKVLALGALLAAIELDLPVMYVETRAFGIPSDAPRSSSELVHIWLHPTPQC